VLWFIAVYACLGGAVFASEDSAVLRAVEGLEVSGAAVHAGYADFELLGVSVWWMLGIFGLVEQLLLCTYR
jgi:hypothetical protein